MDDKHSQTQSQGMLWYHCRVLVAMGPHCKKVAFANFISYNVSCPACSVAVHALGTGLGVQPSLAFRSCVVAGGGNVVHVGAEVGWGRDEVS